MFFSIGNKFRYRNPYCALCNPDGLSLEGETKPSVVALLSILLDASRGIPDPTDSNSKSNGNGNGNGNSHLISHCKGSTSHEPKDSPHMLTMVPLVQNYNLSNCTIHFPLFNCGNLL